MGVFPGYVIFSTLLSTRDFNVIEGIGLILALSYAINTFIGSLLMVLPLMFFSPAVFLAILWGGLAIVVLIKRQFSHERMLFLGNKSFSPLSKSSKRTLLFASLLILTSSYILVFSCDVGDPALSGDITRYLAQSITIRLGQQPQYLTDRPLFLIFPLVAQLITGLHAFYAYAGLQFYLLMVPASFYILLKTLFPQDKKIPTEFSLTQNYPNPFNPETVISYSTPKPAQIRIEIYNAIGKKIRTLVDDYVQAGQHQIIWDGKNDNGIQVSTGIYYYIMQSGNFRSMKKAVFVK